MKAWVEWLDIVSRWDGLSLFAMHLAMIFLMALHAHTDDNDEEIMNYGADIVTVPIIGS
jgi:hypothetical protein